MPIIQRKIYLNKQIHKVTCYKKTYFLIADKRCQSLTRKFILTSEYTRPRVTIEHNLSLLERDVSHSPDNLSKQANAQGLVLQENILL